MALKPFNPAAFQTPDLELGVAEPTDTVGVSEGTAEPTGLKPFDPYMFGEEAVPAGPRVGADPTPVEPILPTKDAYDFAGRKVGAFGESSRPVQQPGTRPNFVDELTRDVLNNQRIVEAAELKPKDIYERQAIREALNLPDALIDSMNPSMREQALRRQDVQVRINQLAQAPALKLKMAESAEASAILMGYIPALAASEAGLRRAGYRLTPPRSSIITPIPSDPVSFIEGSGNAIVRGFNMPQIAFLRLLAEKDTVTLRAGMSDGFGEFLKGEASRLFKRDTPITDNVFLDTVVAPVAASMIKEVARGGDILSVISAPFSDAASDVLDIGSILVDMGYGLKDVGDKDAAQAAAQSAVNLLNKASKLDAELIKNYPWSDKSKEFLNITEQLSKQEGMGDLDKALLYLQAMKQNPLAASAFFTEVFFQETPNLAAAGVVSRVSPSAAKKFMRPLGIAVPMYIREAGGSEVEAYIKEKYNYDLSTQSGAYQFMADWQAQKDFDRVGQARGVTIGAFSAFGMYAAGVPFARNAFRNFGAQVATQGVIGGAGEYGAVRFAGMRTDIVDIMHEIFGEMNPVSVATEMIIAGQTIRNERATREFLKTGDSVKEKIAGVPVEDMKTVSEVIADGYANEGIDTIYIEADQILSFSQENDTVIETLGLDQQEVQQAAAEGGDISIDVATYIRHIVGQQGFEQLSRHARSTPESISADDFEFAENTAEMDVVDEIAKRVRERVNASEEEVQGAVSDINEMRRDLARQIVENTDRPAEEAELLATVNALAFATRAAKITKETGQETRALDLYLEQNIIVQGTKTEDLITVQQNFVNQVREAEAELSKGFKDDPIPELEEATKRREAGDITQEEYNDIVSELKPVRPYTRVPTPATRGQMFDALDAPKKPKLNIGNQYVGQEVGLRLDIPAYTRKGVWVPTIHVKGGTAHEAAARITGVTFTQPGDTAERKAGEVGRGDRTKSPFAQMRGTLDSVDPAELEARAQEVLNDPEWTQVGYDPRRHTFFYDRATQQPVLSADEVIQVGPLVLAKNAVKGEGSDFLFQDKDETPKKRAKKIKKDIEASETPEKAKKEIIARVEDAGGQVLEFDQVDRLVDSDQIKTITLQDLLGIKLFPTIADRTAAGALYTGIEGAELSMAVPLLGGPFFPLRMSNVEAGTIWADRGKSVEGAKLAKVTEQGATHMLVTMGDPNMHVSNTTVSYAYFQTLLARIEEIRQSQERSGRNIQETLDQDTLLSLLTEWNKTKPLPDRPVQEDYKTEKAFKSADKNWRDKKNIREGVNNFPGFTDTQKMMDHLHSISFEARKQIMKIMGSKAAENITGINLQKILNATREPSLSGLGWGDGVLLLEIDTETPFVELGTEGTERHPDFPLGMRGKVVGKFDTPINYELLFQDWISDWTAEQLAAGKEEADLNSRRAFELSRPVIDVSQELLNKVGDVSAPGVPTRLHARLVLDTIQDNWLRNDITAKAGGIKPADFKNAFLAGNTFNSLDVTENGNVVIPSGLADKSKIELARLGKSHTFYALDRKEDGRVYLSTVINNDSGTEGIGEVMAVLDAVAKGATDIKIADTDNMVYAIAIDIGFKPNEDGSGLVWTGDENVRENIVARYLDDGNESILSVGDQADVQTHEALFDSVVDEAVGKESQPEPGAVGAAQTDTIEDSLTSRARNVAAAVRQLSPEARANLGFTDAELEFRQDTEEVGRGSFNPSDLITDQQGNPANVINIFESADKSTFLHESGHMWLEMLRSDASNYKGSFDKDWNTVKDWWASNTSTIKAEAVRRAKKDGDTASANAISSMSDAAVRRFIKSGDLRASGTNRWLSISMHEQFARGVEDYFARGEAPSVALADIMIEFALWIRGVYRRLTNSKLDVRFSPEVQKVMDRMLASDEEIEYMASQYNMTAILETAANAGMTKEQFTGYQEQLHKAKEQLKIQQLAKHQKDEERAKREWWQQERESMRDDVTKDVANTRVYRLIWSLLEGGLADGSSIPTELKVGRLDQKQIEALLEEMDGVSLSDLSGFETRGRALYTRDKKQSPTSPAYVAALFGYEDAQEMIRDIATASKKVSDEVDARLDEAMEEIHGTMNRDGLAEATSTVHSDPIARIMAIELEAMRTTEPAFKTKFLKAYARKKLLDMKISDISPRAFLAAEKRHAKRVGVMLRKGDKVGAYANQFQRMINHHLATEAIRFQKNQDSRLRLFRKYQNKTKKFPTIDADYIDALRNVLDVYDFGSRLSAERMQREIIQANLDKLQEVIDFVENEKLAEDTFLEVPQWILDKQKASNWQDITAREFTELYNTVKLLETQGRLKKKLKVGREDRDRAEVQAEMMSALNDRPEAILSRLRSKENLIADWFENQGEVFTAIDTHLLKVEFLLEAIDGKPLGVWHQTIYQPMADAYAEEQDISVQITADLEKLLSKLPKKVSKRLGKRVPKEELMGLSQRGGIMRSQLIMMALNTGTESNFDKMVRGLDDTGDWNINKQLVEDALDNVLTKEEWDIVSYIWKKGEELYPRVIEISREEYGRAPTRVEPRTVKTKYGDIQGGYFPMMYDRQRDVTGKLKKRASDSDIIQEFNASVGLGTVDTSMMQERVEQFAAPILLDITKLTRGLQNTSHMITHYRAIHNARKALKDPDLHAEFNKKVGKQYLDMIENWLSAQTTDPATDISDRWTGALARNATVAMLGYSYTTLFAQILGHTTLFDRLTMDKGGYGGLNTATTIKDMTIGISKSLSPTVHRKIVQESGVMRHRMANVDRDMRAAQQSLDGKKDSMSKSFAQASMAVIAAAQYYTVDVPAWVAAYNTAINRDSADHAGAVKYADRVVRMSQASGAKLDLAEIQRKPGLWKSLTMFYTFFSALYAITKYLGKDLVSKPTPGVILRTAVRLFIVYTLQEVGTAFVKGKLPDWEPEEEDDDDLMSFALRQTGAALFAGVPLARDIYNGLISDFGYSASPVASFGESISKLGTELAKIHQKVKDEEIDGYFDEEASKKNLIQSTIMSLGILRGLPAVQLNRTVDGYYAMVDEEEGWSVLDLMRGYDPDIAAKRD